MATITLKLNPTLESKLRKIAESLGISLQQLILNKLNELVKTSQKDKKEEIDFIKLLAELENNPSIPDLTNEDRQYIPYEERQKFWEENKDLLKKLEKEGILIK